nr:DUF4139 domain-containing protein [uncultured Mucilaginibacter sp.]
MLKKLTLIICLVVFATTVKADDGQKVESKVQKVTVFLNGAQVTRTATAQIAAGTSTLIFGNISPDIDVQSLQVRAAGDFTILSVKNELNYLDEQTRQNGVLTLQAQQKAIRDKIAFQNTLRAIDSKEEEMLSKNQVVSGDNASLDLIKLKQALDFQTARLTEIKKREIAQNEEITRLTTELKKYDKQIADALKGSSKATGNILVTISSKAATSTTFTLSYVVKNAAWYPTYDIRAKNVNSPIAIAYKANVSQQSGEEWKNIKLTLSTGNPTVSGSKPQLDPYYLNYGMFYQSNNAITKVSGTVFDNQNRSSLPGTTVRVKGTSIATATNADGKYTIQIPGGANHVLEFLALGYESIEQPVNSTTINAGLNASATMLNEVVITNSDFSNQLAGRVAGLNVTKARLNGKDFTTTPIVVNQTENQTNIEFNIDDPYTIPGDGKQYLVNVSEVELPATYQYYTAPKLSTDVFLTASLTDWNKYNFLSGEANLFFEGTFIGKSLIDTQVSSDTLNLSLGVDKNIVVTRTLQKDLAEKQSLGSNKKETKNWQIVVKNRKNQQVNLLVEDQVPVSQNSAIEVETQELSAGNMDKTTGRVSWNLTLNSQAEKKLDLKYQVKYPKNQQVIVQ